MPQPDSGVSPRERLARLRWRCRRGMRELDVVLLRTLERDFEGAGSAWQQAFERLLSRPDPEILDLLTGRLIPEDQDLAHVIDRLLHHD